MSRRRYLGTQTDQIYSSPMPRVPGYKILIWNPNRTTINEVVLGTTTSPSYDITAWCSEIDYTENLVFENSEESQATSVTLTVRYDANASPIQITEKTLIDGAPVKVYQGDQRVPFEEWVCIFTGIIRGYPTVAEETRDPGEVRVMKILCVERAEAFLNTTVTARSYEKGTDVGQAAVETAIEFMGLDRREINIGDQGYLIGHTQSQLVDIEVMKGIYEILFTVGKKPKFDGDGFLCAADTDLSKAPFRIYDTHDLIMSLVRQQVLNAINNSVRLMGLDDELTAVIEREKRLVHGEITSGYFDPSVRQKVSFSEKKGKESGSQRAKDTRLEYDVGRLGSIVGEHVHWDPTIEPDGFTCFGGVITFDTGWTPTLRTVLFAAWSAAVIVQIVAGIVTSYGGLEAAAAAAPGAVWSCAPLAGGLHAAATGNTIQEAGQYAAEAAMIAILVVMSELGRCEWEVYGCPFQNVFQQLCATAQLYGLVTAQIREIQLRNDWLYDIGYMEQRAKELLKRELIKGWSYEIRMMDDPLLEVDDVIEVVGRRYYITSIHRRWSRSTPDGTMSCTAWRLS